MLGPLVACKVPNFFRDVANSCPRGPRSWRSRKAYKV